MLIFAGHSAAPLHAAEKPAELVVLNGKVLMVDAASRHVAAVAVRDGVFVAVGANDEVRKFIGAGTRVIDAKDRTAVPGLIETHVHATGAARRTRSRRAAGRFTSARTARPAVCWRIEARCW